MGPPLEGDAKSSQTAPAPGKFDLAENHLLQGPWAMDEQYTVADGHQFVFTRWARRAGMLVRMRFARLNDHLDRIQARPSLQRVLAAEGLEAV